MNFLKMSRIGKIILPVIVGWTFAAKGGLYIPPGFSHDGSPMEGSDRVGRAVMDYRLGTITLGNSSIPVFAYWTSADKDMNSMFGAGWHIPLFECRMLPLDANTYEMTSLTSGRGIRFYRDIHDRKRLTNRFKNAAIIDGDNIRIFCGRKVDNMPDMVFRKGRLILFRYQSTVFNLEYERGHFSQMTCSGRAVCALSSASGQQGAFAIDFGKGKKVQFRTEKMEVCIGRKNGKPIINPLRTLRYLKSEDGKEFTFQYGVNQTGNGRFSDGENDVTWNADSRTIRTLNKWIYEISDVNLRDHTARLRRRNAGGAVEEFYKNWTTGESVKEILGCREVSRIFTSGKLRGKLRWREATQPGVYKERTEYLYDENGGLAYFKRIDFKKKSCLEGWYDSAGRIVKSRVNGDDDSIREYIYNPAGTRVAVVEGNQLVHRSVPNAEEFVKWYNDAKKGIHYAAPTIKESSAKLSVIDVSKGVIGQ